MPCIPYILLAAALAAQTTERVSVSSSGGQSNNCSWTAHVNRDGRYVTYHSWADNLVPGDQNGYLDCFLYDRLLGTTQRLSVSRNGTEANQESFGPTLSADGNFAVFASAADNLLAGDTNGLVDLFLWERGQGVTQLVSAGAGGALANSVSTSAFLSAHGRYAAFQSEASNLVAGDTNGVADVFVRDLLRRVTTRASVTSNGGEANGVSHGPSVSADGEHVAFHSLATNLVAGDVNGTWDVFVHHRRNTITRMVSYGQLGQPADGPSSSASLSGDGRYVAFGSLAANLVPNDSNGAWDAFVRDLATGAIERVSVDSLGNQANGDCVYPMLSADGRFVAFHSVADNLVPGDANGYSDLFIHDRETGETQLVTLSSTGQQTNASSGAHFDFALSGDGRAVAFVTPASNLVPGDTNDAEDIFVRDFGRPSLGLVADPAHRGATIELWISNLGAGEDGYALLSLTGRGAGACPLPLGGLCLDVLGPVDVLGLGQADDWGTAIVSAYVPAGAALMPLYLQAVVPRGPAGVNSLKSAVVTTHVVP